LAAPIAPKLAVWPAHIGFAEAAVFITGIGFTIKFSVCVLLHGPVIPVIVYCVFEIGLTVTVLPIKKPGFQLCVVAPLAVNVAICPIQIAVGLAEAVMVGVGFTVIVIVFEFVHVPLSPKAVKVVVAEGVVTATPPGKLPGCQVKLVAPEANSATEMPLQTELELAETPIIGKALTVIAIELLEVQTPVKPITLNVVFVTGETTT
jgi:hypothetical protein